MGTAYRRYEFLLPLRFNDGRPIPHELVGDVLIRLREQVGAVSWEPKAVEGMWESEGTT